MSSESAPKPRFVLCPKCRHLLQEPLDFDVYKCGGCGTTLQAKKRKSRAVNSESSTLETNPAATNASDLSPKENVLSEKATSFSSADCSSEKNDRSEYNGEQPVTTQENGLREKHSFSSSGECSMEENTVRSQLENGECNGEQAVTSQENASREKRTNALSGECSVDGIGGMGQIENAECIKEKPVISQENGLGGKATSSSKECSLDENGECDNKQIGPYKLSDEEPEHGMDIYKPSDIQRHAVSNKSSSNEFPHRDIEPSATLMEDNSAEKANETNLKLEKEELSNGNMPLEGAKNQFISALDKKFASDKKSALVEVKSEVGVCESDLDDAVELNNRNLSEGADQKLSSGSDGDFVNNEKVALVSKSHATDVDGTHKENSKELNNGKLLLQTTEEDIGGNPSTGERSSTENFASERGGILHVSRSELKEDTSDNHASSPKNIDHNFENLRSADTFDNPEVSNLSLEINGVLKELYKSPTRSSHAYDGSVSSNDGMDERFLGQNLYSFGGASRKGKGIVNSMLYEDIEMQHQSNFPNRKYQNEAVETTRYDHAYRMRTIKDEFPFKMPLQGNGLQSGYESASPSNQIYDELNFSSSYVSPESAEDPDQEKMKLLQMVYKLQDQLNRTNHANRETNERLSAGNHVFAHQSPDVHEGRVYPGLDYPRVDANSSYSHDINMHQRRHNFSRIPTSTSHHVDQPCFNCFPQEQQYMGEFPLHFPYQHDGMYRPHPIHNHSLSHQFYPSSPQWLTTSKQVHSRETKSCDQRQQYRVSEMNYTSIRDKPSLTKRHYRPVAGGAPFITCHKCLKLLQLPADFLLFKRVCHKLKCGDCQEVLKFSLQNRSHIVSYAPNSVEPSSSELVQNKLNGINSHVVDRVSYSDDYDHSISKSYSSEGDPVSGSPFHHLHKSARDNPSVSPGTIEAITEKENIASSGPSTSKAPTNMSSERETPQSLAKTSALHQLMGYSSPSQVIRGAPSSVKRKETMLSGEY